MIFNVTPSGMIHTFIFSETIAQDVAEEIPENIYFFGDITTETINA